MSTQVVVMPSAPLLVPELAGPAAVDTIPVRDAVLAAGTALASSTRHWTVVGVSDGALPDDARFAAHGDFGPFGVSVPVDLPGGSDDGARLPLSLLLAGWLAGRVAPTPTALNPELVEPAAPADRCRSLGREISARLAGDPTLGLLVVADGATALSRSAPGGGERASAWELQHRIDAAVAAADPAALVELDDDDCRAEGVRTRAAWQVLGGVLEDLPMDSVDVLYAEAPFGVGYTVATLGRST